MKGKIGNFWCLPLLNFLVNLLYLQCKLFLSAKMFIMLGRYNLQKKISP
jgi:hypothetical protein